MIIRVELESFFSLNVAMSSIELSTLVESSEMLDVVHHRKESGILDESCKSFCQLVFIITDFNGLQ